MEEGKKRRNRVSSDKKYQIIKEALTTDSTVSEVCRKYGIGTNVFYKWQEKFLAGAKAGFDKSADKSGKTAEDRVSKLTQETDRLKGVIAEIAAENIELKKKFSDS